MTSTQFAAAEGAAGGGVLYGFAGAGVGGYGGAGYGYGGGGVGVGGVGGGVGAGGMLPVSDPDVDAMSLGLGSTTL
jgi:hypothetical protein